MKDVLKAIVFGGLFAVPFLTLYVANEYFFPYITGKNFWFRIIIDVTFAAWIILALYEAKYRPRISGIVWSFGALLVVMFFADLFGKHPTSSFWSNFERMDGYVSLVHTFMYMLVLGSVLRTKKHWEYLFNMSLFVAFTVALYGLAQYGGMIEGSDRVDSRLGNAAYMAVYMLFHVFMAIWLLFESKSKGLRGLYLFLVAMFIFVLIQTGTRGTFVGLVAGLSVMFAYLALFGTNSKKLRKYSLGAIAVVVLMVGGLVAARDSNFVKGNANLQRFASISLEDLTVRSAIWEVAWEGVKERPLLGWGQSNFNFVFNKYYDPSLYAQEQWFDRSHDVFFDWLITGGFLGLLAYLSIFAYCGYYLFLRPLLNKDDESFTPVERAVLLGLLAGYFTHNLVVFDNVVSYMFFAVILGLIHSRVSTPCKAVEEAKVDEAIITQFAAPVIVAILVAVFYFWYMPGMQAAGEIIDAMREPNPEKRLEIFKTAIERDSFAKQEIVEQLAQQAINIASNQEVPEKIRTDYAIYAEAQLLELIKFKPDDARVHVFVGSFYRSFGQQDKAADQMAIARSLSPLKQSIINQQGFIEVARGDYEAARDYFKEAAELDSGDLTSREYYIAGLLYANQLEEAKAQIDSDILLDRAAQSNFVLAAANQSGYKEFMAELFEHRVVLEPDSAQNWASLAFLYYDMGDNEKALDALYRGGVQVPNFEPAATCFSDNIKAGINPKEGC